MNSYGLLLTSIQKLLLTIFILIPEQQAIGREMLLIRDTSPLPRYESAPTAIFMNTFISSIAQIL